MAAERGWWRQQAGAKHGRMRERPPRWKGRREPDAADGWAGRRRWLREPEPFEDRGVFEPYPGATVLEDLGLGDDDAATLRVLARYTVIRVVILSSAGALRGPKLVTERRVALEHLALLPVHDWERRVLQRLVLVCHEEPVPAVVAAATAAAESAAKQGHAMGAAALYRAVYELARDREWCAEAGSAARGMARLARLHEAPVSARIWSWRERVMEVRQLRLDAAAALAADEARSTAEALAEDASGEPQQESSGSEAADTRASDDAR